MGECDGECDGEYDGCEYNPGRYHSTRMDLYRCSTLLFTFVQTSIFWPFRVLTQGRASRETEYGLDMGVSRGRWSKGMLYLATLRMIGRCSGWMQGEEGRVTSFLLLSRAGLVVSFLNYSSASSQKRQRRSGLRRGQRTGSCLICTLCSNVSKKARVCEGCGCGGVSCWEWEVSWSVVCVLRMLSASCLLPACSALRESRSRIILVQFLSCITPINLNYYSPWQLRAISRGRRGRKALSL